MARWLKTIGEWILLAAAALAIGIGAAWAEQAFGLASWVVPCLFLTIGTVTFAYAAYCFWQYQKALSEEDEWGWTDPDDPSSEQSEGECPENGENRQDPSH